MHRLKVLAASVAVNAWVLPACVAIDWYSAHMGEQVRMVYLLAKAANPDQLLVSSFAYTVWAARMAVIALMWRGVAGTVVAYRSRLGRGGFNSEAQPRERHR